MPAADIPVNSARLTWKTPSNWKELAPTSIRIGNFAIPGQDGAKAEAAIFSFPGAVGTELDNVNRWRNELKLAPIGPEQIVSSPVTVDGSEGKLYEFNGDKESIVVASVPRGGAMWFFKMKGDKDVVTDAEPVFRDFLQTVKFAPSEAAPPPSASVTGLTGSNPHGDLSGGNPHELTEANPHGDLSASDTASPEPKWNPPADWKETAPGPMIFKRFVTSDAGGDKAEVTVSFFPGDVGGVFANVNRWRRQMGLPPVEEGNLGSVTQPVDTSAGKATLVDFAGTDARTGQPARLVAFIVPHGDSTWFYKLMGNGQVVEAQKEKFMKFVQSVQYPQ